MKKVLCFIDSLGAGGAQRQLVGLASMLKEKNYKVKVIVYHNEPFYENLLVENDVDFEWVKKAENKYLRIYYILNKIREYSPDWVISYLDTPCIISCIAKLLNRKLKLIVSERNTTQIVTAKERVKFLLYRFADIIVSNSYSQGEFIKRNFSFLEPKTTVIPNFVDTIYFQCSRSTKKNIIPKFVIIASIWEPKNTLGFIEALRIVKEAGYNFFVEWYGISSANNDYLALCINKIEEYKLNKFIQLKEKTSDIKSVYAQADFFCLPSFYEGTPNVICEAMSCGLPIMCSNVCDNHIYVKNGKNGVLFDPKDVMSIADGMIKMLSLSDCTYYEYSKYSRKIAEQLFSMIFFIERYISLISK